MNYGFVNTNILSLPQINSIEYKDNNSNMSYIFYENKSGSIDDILSVFNNVKSYDTVITSSLINFSLNLACSVEIVSFLFSRKIIIKSILDDYKSPDVLLLPEKADYSLNLSFHTIKKFNDFSKNELSVKQKIGINRAKEEGKYKNNGGSKAYQVNNFPLFYRFFKEWKKNIITKTEFAEKLGVSRPTLDKLLKTIKIESGEKRD